MAPSVSWRTRIGITTAGRFFAAFGLVGRISRILDNDWNLPAGPNDGAEDHPYKFTKTAALGKKDFKYEYFERTVGKKGPKPHPHAHAAVINEYGWIWLNRDGSPTLLIREVWDVLAGPKATAEERLALNGYLLAGETEYWRAHRNYTGVMHFVYLAGSYKDTFTCRTTSRMCARSNCTVRSRSTWARPSSRSACT
jgi:hypothetical protein